MSRVFRQSSRRGVECVEAALVLPLIVLLTFGFIEIGFYVNCYHILHDATRQGARAAVRPENSNPEVQATVLAALNNAIAVDGNAVTIRISKLTNSGEEQYEVTNFSDNEQGEAIRVTVTVDYAQFNSPSNYLGLASQSIASSVVMQRQK